MPDQDLTPEAAAAIVRRLLLLLAELSAVIWGRTIKNSHFSVANSSKLITMLRRSFADDGQIQELVNRMEEVRAKGLHDPESASEMISLIFKLIDEADLNIYSLTLPSSRFS